MSVASARIAFSVALIVSTLSAAQERAERSTIAMNQLRARAENGNVKDQLKFARSSAGLH